MAPGGVTLPKPIEYDCHCVPKGSTCDVCADVFDRDVFRCPDNQPADRVLCGCAMVYLR